MTATATARTTRPALDDAPAPARRRWHAVAAVLVVLVGAAVAVRSGEQAVHTVAPLDTSVRGTYLVDDGRHLTLWGSARSPRYELDGQVTFLVADGTDRYTTMDGQGTVAVDRDVSGLVTGIRLETADGSFSAVPSVLHSEREIAFSSGSADLVGTLLLPSGRGPHPAVVIVHGAERNADRENYRLLGSHFARRGVAALIYDKRGVGGSSGSFSHATFDDLTGDAVAAVRAVAAEPGIDPARVGVLGFSQGGWVVAQAARVSDAIAFVAAYSPSGFSPGDQQAWLHGSMLTARGFGRDGMVVADRVSRMLYSSLDLVGAGLMPAIPQVPGFWFHALDLHTDSTALWQGVRQPVLLAWGAMDCQVPAHDSMQLLGEALRRGGNSDVTLTVLAEADHSFTLVEPCGHETGIAHHASMHYAPGYFDVGPDWVHAAGDPDGARPDLPIADPPGTPVLRWHLDPPAPAPWYGAMPAQLAALVLLLGGFGWVAGSWVAALLRRTATGRTHLAGACGVAGLLATLTGLAAFTEIAMLGDTHAAFLAGGPTVDGSSPLMTAARLLVVLAAGLGIATAGLGHRGTSARWAAALGTPTLVAWAAYWQLLPLA